MHHELRARTIKALEEEIYALEKNLKDIESDFVECAKTRKSPCFFCVNNDSCDYQSCNFVWKTHN